MNIAFEDAFKDVFAGVADSNSWQMGFEDAIAGKQPQSEERNYINGYNVGEDYANNNTRKAV